LFLDCLTETSDAQQEYAIGGLCNLSLDKQIKDYILKNDGVKLVMQCLSSSNEETVLSAITTLMFLMTPESKNELTSVVIVDAMLRFAQSSNPRLRNLANVYLLDYCPPSQVQTTLETQQQWANQAGAKTTQQWANQAEAQTAPVHASLPFQPADKTS